MIQVEVEIGSKQALGSLNDLRAAATGLEDKLNNTEFGTAEFKRLANQLKSVRSDLKDFDLQLEGLDKEQRATALVDTFSGLTGAVGAVSSAFLAFGANSEAIEGAERKLLGVIGVVSGLRDASNGLVAAGKLFGPTFDKLGDAIKGGFEEGASGAAKFKTALISTGIGAAIAAVGYLVANFDKLTGATEEETKAAKKSADARKRANEEMKRESDFITQQSAGFATLISRLKETNAGSKERETLIKQINGEYGTTLKNISDEEKFQASLNAELKNYLDYQRQKFQLQKNEELIQKNLEKQDKLRIKLREDEVKWQGQVSRGTYKSIEDAKSWDSQTAIAYENNRKELEATEKRFAAYGSAANNASSKINDLTDNGKKFVKQNESSSKSIGKTTDALAKQRDALQAKLDLDLAANESAKQKALTEAKSAEDRINIEKDFNNRAIDLQKTYTQAVFDATKKEEQNRTQLNADIQNLNNERLANEKSANDELALLTDQRDEAIKTRQESFIALTAQLNEEAANNRKKALEEELNDIDMTTIEGLKRYQEIKTQLIEEEKTRELAANEKTKQDRLKQLDDQYKEELKRYEGREEEIKKIKEQYAPQIAAVERQAADTSVAITEDATDKITELNEEVAEKSIGIVGSYFEQLKQKWEGADLNGKLEMIGGAVNQVSSMVSQATALFNESEAEKDKQRTAELQAEYDNRQTLLQDQLNQGLISQNEFDAASIEAKNKQAAAKNKLDEAAFNREKKLKLANAYMTTAQAVLSAFASGGNPIIGAVLAAAAAVFGGIQIANIQKQQFNAPSTGGGGGGSVPSPSLPSMGNGPSLPTVNYGLGGSNQNIPQPTGDNNNNTGGNLNVVKTYVLAGDVTSAQAAEARLAQKRTL